jgi:hypothetical protein
MRSVASSWYQSHLLGTSLSFWEKRQRQNPKEEGSYERSGQRAR